ncbi:MAG: TIGR03435 family protein [Acidobacteriota bacterium]|nr:TIGR03435 family protein [Acidobacteriota bacterium]
MRNQLAARNFTFGRKALLGLACIAAGLLPAIYARQASAQAAAAAPDHDIVGTWQGTLHVPAAESHPGIDLRIVNKITRTDAGALKVVDYSIDQGGQGMTATSASFKDGVFKYAIEVIDGSYEGKMAGDGKSISGTWTQSSHSLPLVLERATPKTEWTIPKPAPRLPPMAADANPGFEVATIKPSNPDRPGKAFLVQGERFVTINTTLMDMLTFAYDVQQKQILNAPSWANSEKFDIDGKPDQPGTPNREQLRGMLQKLLADRFQLKFHKDKKELSAYVLTVAKSGPKMTKNESSPNSLPGLFFRGLGVLTVRNATMGNFAQLMQSTVLDRPVVDQTGLTGKWDFLLKWTPDQSQFGGMGVRVPPPSDAADAPPPLFTAMPEQLGLKLDAGKAQVEVLVLDHVEKPSAN